ncbi:unnamed protein product [Somion occarium]|uniref:Peptide N-acetyl-beta-D-glucosaminyl asparaginase amidase A N-terminal domain-containing protein n=1 Tax=Somion occarium TaxID=3059160 RepID=A0ABP1CK94_9APHY
MYSLAVVLVSLLSVVPVYSRPSPDELGLLHDTLARGPPPDALSSSPNALNPRVPLSTNDDTPSPLVDLQVYAPPIVPRNGRSCEIVLLTHEFGDGSYGVPAIAEYTPPTDHACGGVDKWAAITLNVTVYSIGTQYDRLSSLYLSHVEILRHSSAEPTKTGTVWTVKDVTHYSALFRKPGQILMDFSNIISADLGLDASFHVDVTAAFHVATPSFPVPTTSDLILPLSNLSPNTTNLFTIEDDLGGTTNITIPPSTQQAFVEIYASGNSNEEFWYLNTPDEFLDRFPSSTGLVGKGPFREIQLVLDGRLAGVVWPHAVIYTGGITPTNWRPLTAYGTYDQPTYYIDVTPFLPLINDDKQHAFTLRVQGQGASPSINSNWFVSGSVHLKLGKKRVLGKMTTYDVQSNPSLKTTGSASNGNITVNTSVLAQRTVLIESELHGDIGRQIVRFEQQLNYSNLQRYEDDGWVQWGAQLTEGTSQSVHGGRMAFRDTFSYPLDVFSNYSLYDMQFGAYGSAINQTFSRTLQSPFLGLTHTILSVQHARGNVGMDDTPGLRHAINGTGATDQQFAFSSTSGETYFRDIAAKNDGWLRDSVWGTLKASEPPVPKNQIFEGGGHGFRRSLSTRRSPRSSYDTVSCSTPISRAQVEAL